MIDNPSGPPTDDDFHNHKLDFNINGVEEPGDLFCSGHTWMADGRLFVAGGNKKYPYEVELGNIGDFWGDTHVFIFDPFTYDPTNEITAGLLHPALYSIVTTGELLRLPEESAIASS